MITITEEVYAKQELGGITIRIGDIKYYLPKCIAEKLSFDLDVLTREADDDDYLLPRG